MSSQQPRLLCLYGYDPLDRLIDHAQPDTPKLQRFYCKSRLATEIQGEMQHSIFQHDDQLLAQQRRVDDVFDNALMATDQQRSVLHTLDKNPAPKPIAYSPYGHRGESGLASLLGFNGQRPDPVTGHYLLGNGYRAYNPVLMRFNSPDSLSPFGRGGLNSYAYCLGDPVNRYDPTGHVSGAIISFGRSVAKRKILENAGNLKTPAGGVNELMFVKEHNAIWLNRGRGQPEALKLKQRSNGPIKPEEAIAKRNELVDLEYSEPMQRDSEFFFNQLEAASNHPQSNNLRFLEEIMDADYARGFNQDKVNKIIEKGRAPDVPKEWREHHPHAVEFRRGLEANYASAMKEIRKKSESIRSEYFQ
ncbi:hypothetical protein PS862_03127 [Pseudomonas fluorescens]|uniref:Teneurin-like YD-shell domain-containing protein n=1 Tax=Pseudomonas fluorescens TaxID=294 RepID=A0A5E6W5Y2_PSEFL|nr:RHS repeat-associated core domain-containing protein [Pseudomonas fluorescens]VVN23867.1 hypothetical protein PS639_04431 [Pseudomonas fluorescens]VVP06503.1 hypothetical protein PS862_03127 [Pseudomonas fluorescens]